MLERQRIKMRSWVGKQGLFSEQEAGIGTPWRELQAKGWGVE